LGSGGWSAQKIYTTQIVLVTQFPNYLGHFAAGMTAAWLFVWFRRPEARLLVARFALPVQIVGIAVLLAVMRHEGGRALSGHSAPYDQWTRTTWIACLFALVVLATSLSRSWAQLPVANPVSRWVGDVSYGIYLSHLILIGFAATTLGILPTPGHTVFLKLLAFVLPGALIVGFLSWTFVEQPARLWARRRSHRRRAPEPTLAST
jgi:peptidoglycan/LPS O-acetylase OafA/YrhL